jgi:hypothetical protein
MKEKAKMKSTVFNTSSCAAVSLRIGIVIVLTVMIAVASYQTPSIMRLLLKQNILIALLISLLFFIYILCISVGTVVGVVLSVVSFARGEKQPLAAALGLALNAGVLVLLADKFSGGRLFCFGGCH